MISWPTGHISITVTPDVTVNITCNHLLTDSIEHFRALNDQNLE